MSKKAGIGYYYKIMTGLHDKNLLCLRKEILCLERTSESNFRFAKVAFRCALRIIFCTRGSEKAFYIIPGGIVKGQKRLFLASPGFFGWARLANEGSIPAIEEGDAIQEFYFDDININAGWGLLSP